MALYFCVDVAERGFIFTWLLLFGHKYFYVPT